MADDLVYRPQVRAPQAGNLGVTPQSVPNLPDSQTGQAVAQLGNAATALAAYVERGRQETRQAQALTKYLTELDRLETQYSRDTDFQTAEKRFKQDADKLRLNLLGEANLSEANYNSLNLRMTSMQTTANGKVKSHAFALERDTNVANLNARYQSYQGRLLRAGSDVEIQAIENEFLADADAQRNAGWISPSGAEKLKLDWRTDKDKLALARGIRLNPVATIARLQDPNFLPNLDPLTREQAITHAQNAADQKLSDDLTNRARFNPSSITMQIGKVISPDHVVDIFDRGVIPKESSGIPTKVSEKGALGLAQVMPATAREVLRGLGRADVADLPDDELKKKLLENPTLNRQIGLTYFQQQVAKFDGSIPLALAAYNAGPTRVEAWRKKAVEKFGENFTPAQFASVVPIRETQEYILQVYANMGASPDGVQLSPHKLAQVTTLVGNEINAQNAAQATLIKSLADTQRSDNNIVEIYKAGFSVDPETEAMMVNTQRAAAQRGDAAASKWMREYEIVKAHAPFIQQAYRMPLAQLEAQVRTYEAQLATAPNVTAADKTRLDAFRAVLQTVKERRNEDPRSLGERGGLFNPVAIDPKFSPSDPQALAALEAAGQQAVFAANYYGGEIKVFKPQEAETLKARVAGMSDPDKVAFIGAIASKMPSDDATRAALTQVGFDAKTVAAATVAATRPDLLREILTGNALLKGDAAKPKALELRNALSNTLGGQLWPDPKMQDAVVDAALAIYTARLGSTDALYGAADTGALTKAIQDVAGQTTFRGKARVAAPAGMSASEFNALFDYMDAKALDLIGGAIDKNGLPFDPNWLGRNARLKQRAPGSTEYAVMVGENAVFNKDGYPLVADTRLLTPYFAAQMKAAKEREIYGIPTNQWQMK